MLYYSNNEAIINIIIILMFYFLVHQVYIQRGSQNIELFRRTSLILSGQVPFVDCEAQGNHETVYNPIMLLIGNS
jgi:hypothetical protein